MEAQPRPKPNPHNQGVKIHLDRERTLKVDFNALAAFEEATGQNLLDFFSGSEAEVRRRLGFRQIRTILWSALRHEDPELTAEEAGLLVEYAPGDSLGEKLHSVTLYMMTAFASMGGPEAKKKLETMGLPLPSPGNGSTGSPMASSISAPGSSAA